MTGGAEVWDLLVVGGGTAGIVGAQTAAGLGARVLLVERDRTGGDCLWSGCVPSKAFGAAARAAVAARRSTHLGVSSGDVTIDFASTMAHVRGAVAHIAPEDSPEALTAAGVVVAAGTARFVGEGRAVVDADEVHFRQALLATGAAPTVPGLTGLDEIDWLTSDSVWDLEEVPARLVVLGGGTTGCELGQSLARLGSAVTVVESADRLLPHEHPEASAALRRAFDADGVRVITGRAAEAVLRDGEVADRGAGRLVLDDGQELVFDRLLLAVGRTPTTRDLGLDEVGVALDPRGFVRVDEQLRTTNPRIWAAGDLTGHPQLTHVAGVHATLAVGNALLGLRRRVDRRVVPRVTFTDPEVAAVGVDPHRPRPGDRVLEWAHEHVDRAVAEGLTDGWTRVVVDRRGRIAGATVVGPRAGETLGELGLAVAKRVRPVQLAGITHAYPTYNDGPWRAVIEDVRERLDRPLAQRALGGAVGARRWWLDRRRR